jgi:hypothetical protein
MHQEIETNYLMQYAGPMGTEVTAHDTHNEYTGQIVMATPHVIVVLLDHATIPLMFCPITMREVTNPVAEGDAMVVVECGMHLSAVPHGIQIH